MKTLSTQQLAQLKQTVNTLKLMGNIRNPQAMIDLVVPKDAPVRSLISGGDYDSITASVLQSFGFDPAQVREQLVAEGII